MELIPVENFLFLLFPLAVVWYYYKEWVDDSKEIVYATLRMLVQLILIGYVLIYIFENDSWYVGFFLVLIMILMSSYIVMRNIHNSSFSTYSIIFFAIAVGGTLNLVLVIEFILELTPFYEPRYVIPIAGMIYANAMNAVSLAAERFEQEIKSSSTLHEALRATFKASMIPIINSF